MYSAINRITFPSRAPREVAITWHLESTTLLRPNSILLQVICVASHVHYFPPWSLEILLSFLSGSLVESTVNWLSIDERTEQYWELCMAQRTGGELGNDLRSSLIYTSTSLVPKHEDTTRLTGLLTFPRNGIFLKKLYKKFPAFLWVSFVHYPIHNRLQLDPIPSQKYVVHNPFTIRH